MGFSLPPRACTAADHRIYYATLRSNEWFTCAIVCACGAFTTAVWSPRSSYPASRQYAVFYEFLKKIPMAQQMTHSTEVQQCIDACQKCHDICLQTALTHSLRAGGKHAAEEHLRLMINCSEICQTSANFMLSGSSLHGAVCAACAEICDACGKSCEQVGDLDECLQACRQCAASCEDMAKTYQPRTASMRSGATATGASA